MPNGFPETEYRNGEYRYPDQRSAQLPAASQGAHPYAAFEGSGYGDDGYHDPGYQGPAAQDAGIAGTRTVRGFVEGDQGQSGYRSAPAETGYVSTGYQQDGYQQDGYQRDGYQQAPAADGYGQQGYAGSGYGTSHIEIAYPPSAADSYTGSDLYSQPWDYDQPLRYEGEEDSSHAPDGRQAAGDYKRGGYENRADEGAARYQPPSFDPAPYNGSDYSMPGINGSGYDLSGIISTNDFEAIGYDEPSYGRLAYDDPRYGDQPGSQDTGSRHEETRFDVPRYDETRLDNLWLAGDDVRREATPTGYGNDGFGDGRTRSDAPSLFDSGRRGRAAETRYDMRALTEPAADHTRFDVPRFDETRLDNLRPLTPGGGLRQLGTAVLAPPAAPARGWAEDTSLDHFADLDLTDEPVPAAFTRTLDRPQQDDDTAARRAVGRRRGRSRDRRQWMALGAIAVVAAGCGVLLKHVVFSGSSGPAHQVVAPQTVDSFTRSASLEKQMQVGTEAKQVAARSGNQASGVVSAIYQNGSLSGASGSSAQIFMFVGGKLTGADPSASIANFEQTYKGATAVSAGSLGGEAACTKVELNNQSSSMCVWFDNDTFGTVVSPTMTTAKLAATMDSVRPSLELHQK